LFGLVKVRSGLASLALRSMGVTEENVRVEIEKIIGRGRGFVAVEIPFTPRTKRLFERSIGVAKDLERNYISTEHILLGIIDEVEACSSYRANPGAAGEILQVLGVNLSTLRTTLIGLIEAKASDFEHLPFANINQTETRKLGDRSEDDENISET